MFQKEQNTRKGRLKMKKIIALILVIFCMVSLFVGCKNDENTDKTTKENTTAVTGDDVTDEQTTIDDQTTGDVQTTTDPWSKDY